MCLFPIVSGIVHRQRCIQERIQDPSSAARATVISAIRYTFAESTQAYDELVGSMIMDFLSLVTDRDLVSHGP